LTYGERLRELRAERRLSLRQVEERGGPNKDTMSLIERDVHRPHPQTLGRIAGALELSVSDLRAELEGAERPLAQAPPELEAFAQAERREPEVHTGGANLSGAGTLSATGDIVVDPATLGDILWRVRRREIEPDEALAEVRRAGERYS
jgi:transcriptional regulator with XRE-family HTH domain